MKNLIKTVSVILACVFALSAKPLDLMLGARPLGMGGAFAAVADDINAAYWNAAGLSQLSALSFGASHWLNQELPGIQVGNLALAIPIEKVGVAAVSWQMIYSGLESGDPDDPVSYNEDYWLEQTFTLSLSRKLWDRLLVFDSTSAGLSLNRHTCATHDYDGAGLGFDLSLFTLLPYKIRFGFVARSLASDMMGVKVPPEYRFGLAYAWRINPMHRITFASDLLLKNQVEYADAALTPVDINAKAFGGIEYALSLKDYRFDLRGGGYKILRTAGENIAITAGLGVRFQRYAVDYGFKYDKDPDNALGMAHRISFAMGAAPKTAK